MVYVLNRDAQAHLTISSPLEAHKANTITFTTVGVDVGFENPIFACLEVDYEVNFSGRCENGRNKLSTRILDRNVTMIQQVKQPEISSNR